jgi:uncharacterized protein
MINNKMTWKQFETGIDQIISEIKTKNLYVENIYGIPRGGLVLAVCLSHKLERPLTNWITSKDTLIVDDISDSGITLYKLNKFNCNTITLYYYSASQYKPTIWIFEKQPNNWIIFPWENDIKIIQEKDNK